MANQKNDRKVKINDDAKEFAKSTLKRYKKNSGEYYDSKKEMKSAYAMHLIDLLPGAIEFIIKYGYIGNDDVREIKTGVFQKLTDPDFVKLLKREVKEGNKIKNIKLLPIIIKEILGEAKKVNDARLAENPNAELIDLSDLTELSQKILKKKMKKFEKAGINDALAFDLLSVIPTEQALETSQIYRVHSVYDTMYEHAKSVAVPFETIMDILVDSNYYPLFITFALLERKEKFSKLTDSQKSLYLEISNWCFKTMENNLKKDEIISIVKSYVSGRKRDDSQGKDGNRRYNLSTLAETEYPKINKVVRFLMSEDNTIEKYL